MVVLGVVMVADKEAVVMTGAVMLSVGAAVLVVGEADVLVCVGVIFAVVD